MTCQYIQEVNSLCCWIHDFPNKKITLYKRSKLVRTVGWRLASNANVIPTYYNVCKTAFDVKCSPNVVVRLPIERSWYFNVFQNVMITYTF